jgi:thiol:disulfide interchange protein DsbD
LRPGFHVNSNSPNDEYLIPLKLTWAKGSLEAGEIVYPEPQLEHYAFSPKPVSVFTGKFDIVTKFKAAAHAAAGSAPIAGKLRYQACNDKECLPPKTIDVQVSADIE